MQFFVFSYFVVATSVNRVNTHVSMFDGAYGDARMPNWPH